LAQSVLGQKIAGGGICVSGSKDFGR